MVTAFAIKKASLAYRIESLLESTQLQSIVLTSKV